MIIDRKEALKLVQNYRWQLHAVTLINFLGITNRLHIYLQAVPDTGLCLRPQVESLQYLAQLMELVHTTRISSWITYLFIFVEN